MSAYTIALADDHQSFLEGVRLRLEREKELSIVGTASNGREALGLILRDLPDLLLLDMEMPEMSGLEVISRLHRTGSATKVLPLSAYSDPAYILGTLECGAWGYLTKNESLSAIVDAVWTALRGGVYVSSRGSMQGMAHWTRRNVRETSSGDSETTLLRLGITPHLLAIFQLAAMGLNNQEIAESVSRSKHTIRNQMETIKKLIGVKWRPAAVAWAWKNGVHEIHQREYRELYSDEGAPRRLSRKRENGQLSVSQYKQKGSTVAVDSARGEETQK